METLSQFLAQTKSKFPVNFFTHGHCHDLAVALYEILGGQLWLAFADNLYDHTVLEIDDTTWDIDGRDAIIRWTDMNCEFRVEYTDWRQFSIKKIRSHLPIDNELVEELKRDYQQVRSSCLKKTSKSGEKR